MTKYIYMFLVISHYTGPTKRRPCDDSLPSVRIDHGPDARYPYRCRSTVVMRLRFISRDRVASRNSIATNDGNSLRRHRDNGADRKTVCDEISRDLFISNGTSVLPCKHPVHLIIARPPEALVGLQ